MWHTTVGLEGENHNEVSGSCLSLSETSSSSSGVPQVLVTGHRLLGRPSSSDRLIHPDRASHNQMWQYSALSCFFTWPLNPNEATLWYRIELV